MNAHPELSLLTFSFLHVKLLWSSISKAPIKQGQSIPSWRCWGLCCGPQQRAKSRHPASLPGLSTSLSPRELCAHISTAPTQVVAILEKSREDISPCMEHLLEVPHWLTAITGVSEVKGVMSNWGLFHFRDARSFLLVHPMETSNLQAFSKNI